MSNISLCSNNRLRAKRVNRNRGAPRTTDQNHPGSGQIVAFPTAAPFSPRAREKRSTRFPCQTYRCVVTIAFAQTHFTCKRTFPGKTAGNNHPTAKPHPGSGEILEIPTCAPFSPRTRLVYKTLRLRKLRLSGIILLPGHSYTNSDITRSVLYKFYYY